MPRPPPFRPDQYERYKRHLALPEFGVEGQEKLLAARVLLIGAGGLGCPLAQYLAAAGIGTLGIVDDDVIDASNLQRQVLFSTRDVGRSKVEVARERILAQNPDVKVEPHSVRLSSDNAMAIFADYDVIVDGTDNFPTRYLSNDACVLLGKPNVHGSIFRFEGQATVFDASRGPCYRCLYPEPPPPGSVPSCAEGGVLGVLPGIIALIQATETLKLITGLGEPLIGRLLQYDALEMRFREFRLRKDPACPICGDAPTVTALIDYEGFCGMPAHDRPEAPLRERSAAEVAAMRARGEEFLFLDVREPHEYEVARIEGTTLVPLATVAERAEEFAAWKSRTVVVHCRSGVRSAKACRILAERGFARGVESRRWDPVVGADGRCRGTAHLARNQGAKAMAKKSAIPNPLERRHLVERNAAPEASLRLAEAYLAEGRAWEAIVFLNKAGARDRLAELREEAIADGDFFLVREFTRALRDELPAERWRATSEAATAAGKERYAASAHRMAERAEGRS